MFKMNPGEIISEMYGRFNLIVNRLSTLGRSIERSDLVRKVLRSLPREWMVKRTAIEEAKNLNTLSLEDLMGSLLIYELVLKQNEMSDKKVELEEKEKAKKNIAFREKLKSEESSGEEDVTENIEKEIALMSSKLRRLIRYKKENGRENLDLLTGSSITEITGISQNLNEMMIEFLMITMLPAINVEKQGT
ncbi:hypothetical protein LINPERPRIM_LOCUS20478 [Linum perenne]